MRYYPIPALFGIVALQAPPAYWVRNWEQKPHVMFLEVNNANEIDLHGTRRLLNAKNKILVYSSIMTDGMKVFLSNFRQVLFLNTQ